MKLKFKRSKVYLLSKCPKIMFQIAKAPQWK